MEPIDSYCVLISSKVVYFLKPGEYVDREAIFLEVKYDDLYHCLVSKDHGKVYVQLTKKAESTSSGVAIPGPSHQKPMVRHHICCMFAASTVINPVCVFHHRFMSKMKIWPSKFLKKSIMPRACTTSSS